MNAYIKGLLRNNISSALRYEAVTYHAGEYVPGNSFPYDPSNVTIEPSPFKGLHITVAGDVVIRGVDEQTITLTLTVGTWPYGGMGIIESGTTSTGIIALF